MMNNKKYTIIYYLSFGIIILSLFLLNMNHLYSNSIFNNELYIPFESSVLLYINIAITFIITILLIKKKKLDGKIIFPISFILFTILIIIGCLLFNDRVIVPYIHYGYYANFIIYGFTLLNIYTLLSIKKGDNL